MPLNDPTLGLISFVQKYSIKDGPGIRSTVFLKGCPLGCLWCSNPELIRPVPDLLYSTKRCQHCGTCIEVCPRVALSSDFEGFIQIERERCTGCKVCITACPQGALELVGRLVTVEELATDLLKDRVFYQTSGGGVTFSGGEPLWQSGFVARTSKRLKKEDIHITLDTAGEVSWCRFEEVLPFTDLVLYDIKAIDSELHQQLTGRPNELILANARLLAEKGIPLHVRLVMVPGMNDSPDEIHARMVFVSSLKSVQQVDILPYHRYGIGKYAQLSLDCPQEGLEEYSDEQLVTIEAQVTSFGIKTTIGG